jgi:hypothetical protein
MGVDRIRKWLPLLVVGLGVLAYANSFSGTFIFDDIHVLERVARSAGAWFATDGLLRASWRPVTDLTFALNYAAGGAQAADYHAVNLLIHLASALVLYGLVRRTWPAAGEGAAAAAAAAWGVHPLTTSAVTYVAQRYEVLMGCFYLLTLYAAARAGAAQRASPSISRANRSPWRARLAEPLVWWGGLAVIACALGMGAKEVMVTAPLAVLLYDWVFLSDGDAGALVRRRWLLYAGLAACWGVVALMVLRKAGAETAGAYVAADSTPFHYLLTQAGVLWRYLRLSLLPVGLCFDYAWPVTGSVAAASLPLAGMAALACATLCGVVRRKAWSFPWACFFLVLAPTSSLVPRPDPIMEHRMYLPLAALMVLGVGLVAAAWRQRRPAFRAALAGLLLASLATMTHYRNRSYASEEAVWQDVLRKRPHNLRARLGLGAVRLRGGADNEAMRHFEAVIRGLEDSDRVSPGYRRTIGAQARSNLGVVHYRAGRYAEAAQCFRQALALAPAFEDARRNLARARARLP